MKNVIVKALTKADQLSLNPEQAADLVLEYLEIASELGVTPAQAPVPTPPPPPPPPPWPIIKADINRTVKKNPNAPAWKTDELFNHLSKFEMGFTTKPDGWEKEISFRAGLVKDPNGMKGIGVIFQAIESPEFKMNYFFSVDEADVDVEYALDEVKKSVNNILRRVDKPVPNSTVPLRAIPSDIASMAGFTASV
jgi:hypothetical protein